MWSAASDGHGHFHGCDAVRDFLGISTIESFWGRSPTESQPAIWLVARLQTKNRSVGQYRSTLHQHFARSTSYACVAAPTTACLWIGTQELCPRLVVLLQGWDLTHHCTARATCWNLLRVFKLAASRSTRKCLVPPCASQQHPSFVPRHPGPRDRYRKQFTCACKAIEHMLHIRATFKWAVAMVILKGFTMCAMCAMNFREPFVSSKYEMCQRDTRDDCRSFRQSSWVTWHKIYINLISIRFSRETNWSAAIEPQARLVLLLWVRFGTIQ